jgi:hypothetical protein
MNSRPNGLIRFILALFLGLILLRLLPVIARVAQAVIVGLRGYGLILVGGLIIVWFVRRVKRQRVSTYTRDPLTNRPTVDVVSEISNVETNRDQDA